MADPTIPRYEDYFDAQGRPKTSPRPTLAQRAKRAARGLARDITAPDGLGALPVVRPIRAAGAGMGLMRATTGGAAPVAPAANPVLQGAYKVPAYKPAANEAAREAALVGAAVGTNALRFGATLQGRKLRKKDEDR